MASTFLSQPSPPHRSHFLQSDSCHGAAQDAKPRGRSARVIPLLRIPSSSILSSGEFQTPYPMYRHAWHDLVITCCSRQTPDTLQQARYPKDVTVALKLILSLISSPWWDYSFHPDYLLFDQLTPVCFLMFKFGVTFFRKSFEHFLGLYPNKSTHLAIPQMSKHLSPTHFKVHWKDQNLPISNHYQELKLTQVKWRAQLPTARKKLSWNWNPVMSKSKGDGCPCYLKSLDWQHGHCLVAR